MSRIKFKPEYDLVFITHIPCFYKINLYNRISEQKRVAVIFLGEKSSIRHDDFMNFDFQFDSFFLSEKIFFENRNRLKSCFGLIKVLKSMQYKKLCLGGWDQVEFWLSLLLTRSEKNFLVLESSIYESKTKFIAKLIKKLFLKKTNGVFLSGEPHKKLLEILEYKKNMIKTLGVGLFPLKERAVLSKEFSRKFLFIGRLSPEKNILLLLHAFAHCSHFQLTILGSGPQKDFLHEQATENVCFIDHVPNHKIQEIYQQHDCFILPSIKEPWGLVVEEAIHYGLPVLVSNRVGCAIDLVENNKLGLLFDPFDVSSLVQVMHQIQRNFEPIKNNCLNFDFKLRDSFQVSQYCQ